LFPFKASSLEASAQWHDTRNWMYTGSKLRPLMRVINQCALPWSRKYRLAEVVPHSRPIGERVHWSALKRWVDTSVKGKERYAPSNLMAALESVRDGKTPIVGRDGEIVNWGDYHSAEKSTACAEDLFAAHMSKGARGSQRLACGAPA
jgi:hypothetical protein